MDLRYHPRPAAVAPRGRRLYHHAMADDLDTTLPPTEDDAAERAPSWAALTIARVALRFSRYPARGLIGGPMRQRLAEAGGYGFTVRTADGVDLAAWYAPATTSATSASDPPSPREGAGGGDAPAAGEPDTPTDAAARPLPVVLAHGWLEVKEFHLNHIRELNRLGHDVIAFDHRAHGQSTGRVATFGVRERHDLAAVIDAAVERGLVRDRVITVGFSMGAATALQHAPDDERIAGVVAYAPFVDLHAAIHSFREMLAPWIDDAWLQAGFQRAAAEAGFDVRHVDTLEAMARLQAPVLMIEGGRDRNLPPKWHTRKLAEVKRRGTLKLITIDEATHMGICRRPHWPGLDEALRAFYADVCRR